MFTLDQAGRRSHRVEVLPPPPPLRPWVEHLVVDRRPAAERGRWRIVPDPCAHLLVTYGPAGSHRTGPLLGARVVGARTRFVDADVTRRGTTVGVRFRPGGLAPLLRERADSLTDRGIDAAEAFGPRGREAVERLDEATSAGQAVAALTGLLEGAAARCPEPDWRVRGVARALAAGGGRAGPGALADATGMAARTLRAVAASEVGLAPGRWVRIHRLFRALEMRAAAPAASWSWIAARAGYHDPPHLTREFRALLGETPTGWSARSRSCYPSSSRVSRNRSTM